MPQNDDFLRHFRGDDLLISTTRYYLGRMTAITGTFASQLASAWRELPEGAQAIIRRDIQAKFDDDDRARALGHTTKFKRAPLGMECDRACWEWVRTAWQAQEAADEVVRLQMIEDLAHLNRL